MMRLLWRGAMFEPSLAFAFKAGGAEQGQRGNPAWMKDGLGNTPLHHAVRFSELAAIDLILDSHCDSHCDPSPPSPSGSGPAAAQRPLSTQAAALLSVPNYRGLTPLLLSVRLGHVRTFHHLLRRMTLIKWQYGQCARMTQLPLEQIDTWRRPYSSLHNGRVSVRGLVDAIRRLEEQVAPHAAKWAEPQAEGSPKRAAGWGRVRGSRWRWAESEPERVRSLRHLLLVLVTEREGAEGAALEVDSDGDEAGYAGAAAGGAGGHSQAGSAIVEETCLHPVWRCALEVIVEHEVREFVHEHFFVEALAHKWGIYRRFYLLFSLAPLCCIVACFSVSSCALSDSAAVLAACRWVYVGGSCWLGSMGGWDLGRLVWRDGVRYTLDINEVDEPLHTPAPPCNELGTRPAHAAPPPVLYRPSPCF